MWIQMCTTINTSNFYHLDLRTSLVDTAWAYIYIWRYYTYNFNKHRHRSLAMIHSLQTKFTKIVQCFKIWQLIMACICIQDKYNKKNEKQITMFCKHNNNRTILIRLFLMLWNFWHGLNCLCKIYLILSMGKSFLILKSGFRNNIQQNLNLHNFSTMQ